MPDGKRITVGFGWATGTPPGTQAFAAAAAWAVSVVLGLLTYWPAAAFRSVATGAPVGRALGRLWWLYAAQLGPGLVGLGVILWAFWQDGRFGPLLGR